MKHNARSALKALTVFALIAALLLSSVAALAAGGGISRKEARKIALRAAGVESSAVKKWIKVKLDDRDDDGDREWDVEFKTKKYIFEVEIDAVTGAVEEFDKQEIRTKISRDKAKSIALERAEIAGSAVKKWIKVKLDGDEWDVEFKTGKYRFEVEIDACTGKIRDFEKKKLPAAEDAAIQLSEAKEIALNHARSRADLSGRKVKYTKAKLERERGVLLYEIEFRCDGIEFEYEINANTGKILDWDMDRDD